MQDSVQIAAGHRRADTSALSHVELRAFIAVGVGVFFARLFSAPIAAVGSSLPGEAREPVRKALRFYRGCARFSWVDR